MTPPQRTQTTLSAASAARDANSSGSRVLPMPASPESTTQRVFPWVTSRRSSSNLSSSSDRPTSGWGAPAAWIRGGRGGGWGARGGGGRKGGGMGGLGVERGQGGRVLAEHREMDVAQLRAGYGAQFLHEQRTDRLVPPQGLPGPARKVKGAHQECPRGLAQRSPGGEVIGDEGCFVVFPLLEEDVGVQLEGRHPDVLEPGDLTGGEGMVGRVGQGGPAPHAQTALDFTAGLRQPLAGQQPAGAADRLLEAGRVPAGGRCVERVAG